MQHKPLYYPCQLHEMDKSLKIFIEECYSNFKKSTSPQINLDIVDNIKSNFQALIHSYGLHVPPTTSIFQINSIHLRGVYNYLYLFWKAFYSSKVYPSIYFKLPPMNDARWNSKAFFFFMAYFLLPDMRKTIENVVNFLDDLLCANWFNANLYHLL